MKLNSITLILLSGMALLASARAGGGGSAPTQGACWNEEKFTQVDIYYTLQGRRVKEFTSVYVDGRGPLQVTLELANLYYSSGNKCLSFKPKYVTFVIQGPIDFKSNEAFAFTSEDLSIALQKRNSGPRYQVSWTIPVKAQGTRLMYFISAYPDPLKGATDEQLLELSIFRPVQVNFLTNEERKHIDPDYLRRFPKINKP